GVQVENVARVSFAAWRTTQQQRHLTVGNGLLGQVVISDHGMLAVVTEPFANGAAGERRDVLERCRIRSGSCDNDRVLQSARFFELTDELGNGRTLLTYGDVDAVELVVFVASVVCRLLVEESVENDGGLAGLAVTNHELALAAADRDQGVDSLETGGHRFVHGLARQNARSLDVNATALGVLDRTLAVDRVTQTVNNAA